LIFHLKVHISQGSTRHGDWNGVVLEYTVLAKRSLVEGKIYRIEETSRNYVTKIRVNSVLITFSNEDGQPLESFEPPISRGGKTVQCYPEMAMGDPQSSPGRFQIAILKWIKSLSNDWGTPTNSETSS